MVKKRTSTRSSQSKTLAALKRLPGKRVCELTEEERREYDAENAKFVASLVQCRDVVLPEWLDAKGLPRDPLLAASIALAELGEFVPPQDTNTIPLENFRDLINIADGKKRWGLRVAAQMKRGPRSGVADQLRSGNKQLRDDVPTQAEIQTARQVCRSNPRIGRDALATQLEIGHNKASAILDLMRVEGVVTSKKRKPPRVT